MGDKVKINLLQRNAIEYYETAEVDLKADLVEFATPAGWIADDVQGAIVENKTNRDLHIGDTTNPHSVTKAQVGLGNADNTSDIDKPVSTSQAIANTADRDRANHTNTQLSNTISNFASTVRATVLTGLSLATGTVISATDTILSALGKLQNQITNFLNQTYSAYSTTLFQTGSNSYVDITSFSVTPSRAGTYNLSTVLTVSVNNGQDRRTTAKFFKNGVAIGGEIFVDTTHNGVNRTVVLLEDNVTFNGTTDSVTVRVKVSASTLSVRNRKLIASRKGV